MGSDLAGVGRVLGIGLAGIGLIGFGCVLGFGLVGFGLVGFGRALGVGRVLDFGLIGFGLGDVGLIGVGLDGSSPPGGDQWQGGVSKKVVSVQAWLCCQTCLSWSFCIENHW